MNMCVPTFESSDRSYSAVQGLGCSGHPRHNRSRRAAGQRDRLLLLKESTNLFLSISMLIELNEDKLSECPSPQSSQQWASYHLEQVHCLDLVVPLVQQTLWALHSLWSPNIKQYVQRSACVFTPSWHSITQLTPMYKKQKCLEDMIIISF